MNRMLLQLYKQGNSAVQLSSISSASQLFLVPIVGKYRGEDRQVKISVSGDTTMHLAARFGKTRHIREMLTEIGEDEAFEILSVKNDRGNTPLHIAAELGDAAVCYCIALKDLKLLSLTSEEGPTPLCVSVANGNRDAFFSLDSLVQQSRQAIDYSLYKMKNGYTILHAAVFREYFGLAIQIVGTYPDLVNFVDDSGLSPLHILARNRKAFESTALLGFLEWISLVYLNMEELVEIEQERPVINHEFLTRPVGEIGRDRSQTRSRDVENNNLFPQPVLTGEELQRVDVISHENDNFAVERESSDNHSESYPRRHNDLRPQRSFNEPENGNLLKDICGALLSVLGAAIVGVWHVGFF